MHVFTIGHSTHPIREFIAILRAHGVEQLVDVRTIPKSRHNPQFAKDALRKSLTDKGVSYVYIEKLGGLRAVAADSVNKAWRNKSFRGYADYMQTDAFSEGLSELIALAKDKTTAIMCAEVLPWRCHRSLIGDALLVRDITVSDIMSEESAKPHTMTSFAKVKGQTITYPE